MEKISGILPSSPRVSGVDLKEAAPARPGAGGFGRPEVQASTRDARPGLTALRAGLLHQNRLDWRSKDLQHAAVARDLGNRFFGENASRPLNASVENLNPINTKALGLMAAESPTSRPAGFDIDALNRVTGSGVYTGQVGPVAAAGSTQPSGIEAVPFSQVASASTEDSLAAAGFHSKSFMPFDRRLSIEEAKLNDREAGLQIAQPDGLYPPGSFIDVAL